MAPGWRGVLTLDTSALYALMLQHDPHHRAMSVSRDADRGPYIVPVAILAEIGYMLEVRSSHHAMDSFLTDLIEGAYTLDCGERDLPRARELLRKYDDLNLGLADAAVVACAERHRGRVLTADRRHFDVVARGEGSIVVVP